jgi:hypothetical protein
VLHDVVTFLTALGSLATAVAVIVAVIELNAAKHHARTAFEDDLSREYRATIAELPPEAFYKDSDLTLTDRTRQVFYRYFDLSNEQLFLAKNGRVSKETKDQWRDGISGNLRLPAFRRAWDDIEPNIRKDFFDELREVVEEVRAAEQADAPAAVTTERAPSVTK